MIRELDTMLSKCSRCGMCQAVCPLFAETRQEGDVARGKLALLDGLSAELFDQPDASAARLNRCLLCGSCEKNCSCGVNVLEIFLKARTILAGYMGLPTTKKVLLRKVLSNPETFDRLTEWASRGQRLFAKPLGNALGTSCGRIGVPALKGRHFMPLAPTPFHRLTPSLDTQPGASGLTAAFFPGCLLDKIFPEVAGAVVKVLTHGEIGIFMPPEQGCCGIPASAAGDEDTAKQLLRHNLALFERQPWDYLVTACATCTFTIKKVWPIVAAGMGEQFPDRVSALAEKTMDISQFLARHTDMASPAIPDDDASPITYHDPCHLKKSLDVWQEPRALIRSTPRYRLVEMESADRCCGMGGSFNIEHYHLSADIGDRKRQSITATGAETVATGCPACMLQLSDVLSRANTGTRVRHVVELLADRLPPSPE